MPDLLFHHAAVALDADGVATLAIREAKSLNILSTPVIADLTSALGQLAGDASVRAMVLRGSGDRAFVAGADIKEMGALDVASARTFIDEAVRQFPAPVIARIPGWTSIIHAALLPRLIGQARANWLLLTGENIDAQRALSWGLVDAVVAPADLDAEVARTAARFASCGPAVMRQQKRLLREWQHEPLETSILKGVDEFANAFATGEPQRYMQAFVDRPKPH